MNCREARLVLAALTHSLPAERRAEALAHVASCAACRARVDQFGAAIASGFEDEIPCAECRARLDAYVAAEIGRGSPARAFPLVYGHLAACPECAEEYRLVLAGLIGLRDDSLPVPAERHLFDTRFAASRPPGDERRRRRAASTGLAAALRRWRNALSGPSQWAARGALGAVAVLVLALFAGLVAYQPALWLRAQSLAPFNPSLRATAAAYIAATQTVAAGGDREDGSVIPGGLRPGAPVGAGLAPAKTTTATPTLSSPARTATAVGAEATRQARERRSRVTPRPRLLATATITPTLALTVTLAAPTAPAGEEPTREPERPPPTSEPPPEPPPEPPDDPYPPPSSKPSDPYP